MRLLPLLPLLLGVLAPNLAWAHAEEPSSETIFALDDGWVLRANIGIVESSNPAEFICEEAFLGGDGWLLGVLGPREWVTFGESSVTRTEDGCDFTTVAELERRPADAAAHRPSGGAAFLMNGVGANSGLWVSTDRGRTFALIQSFDPATEQTTALRYVDADTIAVSGYSRADRGGAGLLWTVDVATGAPTPIALPEGVTYPYLLAAANEHLALLGRLDAQVIFWGPVNDVAANQYVPTTWPTGAALSADGRTAWITGIAQGKGVARGSLDDTGVATWEVVATSNNAACAAPIGDDLYICGVGKQDGADILNVTGTDTVEKVLDFRDFRGTRSDCPVGSAVATVCPLVWRELAPYLGKDPDAVSDVGLPDSGGAPDGGDSPDAGAPSGNLPTDTTGCCATAGPPATGPGWVIVLVFVGLWRRRALTQNLRRCY